MKKSIIICFFLFLGTYFVFAQNIRIEMPPGYNKIIMGDEIPGKVGSPYLNEAWLPGTILLKNGKKIEGLKYRYCVYNKEMQYQVKNVDYAIGAPDSLKEIQIGQKLFVYLSFADGNKHEKDFFEVLVQGKVNLLVRYIIVIIPANYNKALDVGDKNDEITIKETYYIQKDAELPFLIDKRGENVTRVMADRANDVKEFTSKEHISFKKKNDLIRLVNYYNSFFQ